MSDENAYAGDIPVDEAFRLLVANKKAALVDVRTEPEWQYVGAPDLTGLDKDVLRLSWQVYPSMQTLPGYVERLGEALRLGGADETTPILFLCRSGARSRSAAIAMTRAGWSHCLNVADGFEGPLDPEGRRGRIKGWKARGLPWRQG